MAIRLEAIASRLEAVAIRLETMAIRLEAIAIRLEAIAWRPWLLGWRPSLVGHSGPGLPARASRRWRGLTLVWGANWALSFLCGLLAMDDMDLDRGLSGILQEFSLWGDHNAFLPDRPSLLVQDLQLQTPSDLFTFEGVHMVAAGRGVAEFKMDSVWIGSDSPMAHKIQLLWQSDAKPAMHNLALQGFMDKCLLWNVELLYPPQTQRADVAVDAHSCILPLRKRKTGPIHTLHLFGGAWGGWSFAGQILSEIGVEMISGAVELDFAAARTYAISHRCPLLTTGEDDPLPPLALHSFPEGWCLWADVMDSSWWEAAAVWGPEIVTISAPCPLWSGAAAQRGLHSLDGQLLFRSIALCKLLGPKLILIEQVAAFHAHPHRQWIQKALWFAGYQLRFSHVIELGDVTPVRRARWLGIAYFIHEFDLKFPPLSTWNIERIVTLEELDCILSWSSSIRQRLVVPEEALHQAQQIPLERGNKQARRCSADEAAHSHEFQPQDKCLPTFMAQYGSQHRLHFELLERKGYFAHWLKEADDLAPRFWRPAEIALIHGAWGGFWTSTNFESEWKGLGNQIAIPHALWLLSQAVNMLACRDPQLEWTEVWRYFDEHRMLASTMRPQTFPTGTMWMQLHTSFTMKSEVVDQLFEEGMDCLPKGQCWIPDFGLTKLQEYMNFRGRILDIHCLRPVSQPREQPLTEEPLSATMPMRVMLRCRVVFTTGSKLFAVEWSKLSMLPCERLFLGLICLDTCPGLLEVDVCHRSPSSS